MSNALLPGRGPIHGFIDRNRNQNNGLYTPNNAYYISSGTISNVLGNTTGSVTLNFDAYGLKLTRIEVFHSGNSTSFDVSLEGSSPNTGASYDPRNIFVDYLGVEGSVDYTSGIDQIESLLGITDVSGNLYLKVKPSAGAGGFLTGSNSFKYLTFFEAVAIYM